MRNFCLALLLGMFLPEFAKAQDLCPMEQVAVFSEMSYPWNAHSLLDSHAQGCASSYNGVLSFYRIDSYSWFTVVTSYCSFITMEPCPYGQGGDSPIPREDPTVGI